MRRVGGVRKLGWLGAKEAGLVMKRGRKPIPVEDRVVTVSVTVPGYLVVAMRALAVRKRTSVSRITSRCFQRLAEFHHLGKSDSPPVVPR
jgi:hypothetical protein